RPSASPRGIAGSAPGELALKRWEPGTLFAAVSKVEKHSSRGDRRKRSAEWALARLGKNGAVRDGHRDGRIASEARRTRFPMFESSCRPRSKRAVDLKRARNGSAGLLDGDSGAPLGSSLHEFQAKEGAPGCGCCGGGRGFCVPRGRGCPG